MAVETGIIITSSKQAFSLLNFSTCFVLALGSLVYGYFAGIIGTTLTKASFLSYMGLIDADGKPTSDSAGLIGATTGVFQAGGVFGIVIAGHLADKIGRKRTSIYIGILGIISSAIISASQNVGMFIALRFFTGATGFAFMTVMTVYCAELAPAALRGLYVGLNGALCALGFAISSYFGVAFYNVSHEVQWRVPIALGTVFPVVLTICYLFVPESPRHLLMEGRKEASLKVMLTQHGHGDREDFARAEFFQMEKQAELDMNSDASWKQFYSKPSVRRRVMIAATLAFLSQSTGNLVINNYGSTLWGSLGYDAYTQLCFQAGYITVSPIFNVIGSAFADYVGRRTLLFVGFSMCLFCVTVETCMISLYGAAGTNKAGLATGAAMLFLFQASYAICGDVCVFIIVSEIFPNHLRSKGAIVAYTANALTNLVYLQVAPTAFAHIHWRFFLLFISVTTCGLVWIYFFVPETKGVALEELAEIFGDAVAVHAADITVDHDAHEVHLGGKHIEEDEITSTYVTETNEPKNKAAMHMEKSQV
ncbi:uncharacterized protein Z520_05696 [Fonsecaea multimorphosa CBS 102226]|uniref:Major facilitator superfamily (MFS) profile domain-containing protein n=1 Tax=Fonsecaea multimorphosa CBS 102226 TaxID=1442371 RepID=A0A0D2H963_9EURO|nr:uncharacterized protein Z520_05696 [Fonsecaea multimorphosa CBS 102226]KIX98395.1 hypothetical protein Z520_05696 [Fonsecaea multimorphosa CBS 102226]